VERTFHVSPIRFGAARPARFGESSLSVADPSGEEIRSLVTALRARARNAPDDLPRRARSIAAAARRFLDPDDPIRRRALEALPAVTGFSRPMIEESLPRIFAPLDERSLEAIAGNAAGRAVPVLGIVAAGNIPGVALPQMALALAAGSSCIVKTASGEPLLAALFAEALSEVAPDLGAALAVLWWRGGHSSCDRALTGGVDSLVAYGSDATIAVWSAYGPRRLVAHGHRASLAVVRLVEDTATLDSLAIAASIDVVLYDQLGCLSPQCLFTIGANTDLRRVFLDRLAEALDREGRRLPLGLVPEEHSIAIRRLQDEYEWREIRGEAVSLRKGKEPPFWTIADDLAREFRPSPLYRTLVVRHLESVDDLASALGEWLPRIESVGMGPWPDREVMQALAGIPRLVPLGAMQSPDLAWRQGGLDPMAAIVAGESA